MGGAQGSGDREEVAEQEHRQGALPCSAPRWRSCTVSACALWSRKRHHLVFDSRLFFSVGLMPGGMRSQQRGSKAQGAVSDQPLQRGMEGGMRGSYAPSGRHALGWPWYP